MAVVANEEPEAQKGQSGLRMATKWVAEKEMIGWEASSEVCRGVSSLHRGNVCKAQR